MSETNKPIHTERDGQYKANIWKNEGDNGPYLSITFARTYTDKDGKARDTQSFSERDLLHIAELARDTYRITREIKQELRAEYNQSQQAGSAEPEVPGQQQNYQRQPRSRARSYS